jgi:hypothetical protein
MELTRAVEVEAIRGRHLNDRLEVARFAGSPAAFRAEIGAVVHFIVGRFIAEGADRVIFHSIDAGRNAHEMFGHIRVVWSSPHKALPRVDFVKFGDG